MTITFAHQWKNENNKLRAVPHLTTKNRSFLRTAELLRKMGIDNYAFPITLYDPDLKNVDVYDLEEDNVENERIRIKVQREARRNGWYFLRECVRIYEQGGKPIPFRLDRGSCAMAWCYFNGIDYTGMQPRQTGKRQPLDAKILTPTGWVAMGDLTYDSEVYAPDGTIVGVVGIFPEGLQDVYRITLDDGRSTECGLDHLWRVYGDKEGGEHQILTLDAIRQLHAHPFHSTNLFIPIAETFNSQERRFIQSIEYVGQKESQCIEIDHPDHLYITDDYIVTHNTVCALSLSAWVLYIAGEEFQIGMMAKDNKLREENVKRVKAFGENLPKWWLAEDKNVDKKNATELYYGALRTHYVTFVAQKDKAAADLQARGASPPSFHFDEFEFTVNIGISYPTILASTGTARENAKKNNKPHSNIITTTAGDPTTPPCKEASEILAGAMPFTELLYDIESRDKLHEVVQAASPQKMIIGVFSHLQLGYDNDWLRDKIQRNRMTRDNVMRDYLNRRVSIQDKPIIPPPTLAIINQSEREVNHMQMLGDKFVIYWYISKEERQSAEFKSRSIVIGCDSSEMIGRDATTLIGIDPRTLETVFSFRCSEGNLTRTGVMIGNLLVEYPKMILVPENKSSGTSFIDNVSLILRNNGQNPFYRMFNWVVDRQNELEFSAYNLRDPALLDTKLKRFFGIKTDKSKRDELFSTVLLEAADRAATRVYDKVLIQELNSLTVRNGRVDHAVGGHDDTCFVGDTLVRTDKGNRPISKLKVGDLILTREGYKPLLHIFCREKEVISRFNLVGTADHPFITPDGIVQFKDLTSDSMVYVWNERRSCIEVKSITDTLTLRELNTATTSTDTIRIVNHQWHYIARYGRIMRDLFLRGWKYIIKTKTSPTTRSKILNALPLKSIGAGIVSSSRKTLSSNKRLGQEQTINLVNGEETTQKLLDNTLAIMERKVQDWQTGEETIRNLLEKSQKMQPEKVLKQGQQRKELVYNLHVAECHEYFVNDILVHNCVAWLMAMWFIMNAKNLVSYGIKPGTVMSIMETGQSDADKRQEAQQLKIRERIEQLEKALRFQKDPSLKLLIESDLQMFRDMVEGGPVAIPTTSDELNREPGKFTDPVIAREARPAVTSDDITRSLRTVFGMQ